MKYFFALSTSIQNKPSFCASYSEATGLNPVAYCSSDVQPSKSHFDKFPFHIFSLFGFRIRSNFFSPTLTTLSKAYVLKRSRPKFSSSDLEKALAGIEISTIISFLSNLLSNFSNSLSF